MGGTTLNTEFLTAMAVMVLVWADVLAVYALVLTMTYLTNVWKINFTDAAAMLNLGIGAVLTLPILLAHLADAFVGNFTILLTTTISYSVGLGLLAMSTPPMFNFVKHDGTCSDNKSECIGEEQKHLFYIGLGFIALGMSGHLTSLAPFAAEQSDRVDHENGDQQAGFNRKQGATACGIVMFPIVGIIVITFVKSWSIRYSIAAVLSLVGVLFFLAGCCQYKYVGPQGSSLTTIARVFVASTTKLLYRRPKDTDRLYEKLDAGDHAMLYSRTRAFCCLDKAAIVLPSQPLEEQEKNRWKLCTVTEVEGTKIVLRMIPMWLTFIACGLVSSIGITFFLEQANRMNPKVGRLKVPLPTLLLFYDKARQESEKLYYQIAACLSRDDEEERRHSRYAPPVGIAVSMVIAILCCITSAKVEARRLRVVASHGLADKPDERIPMTMFWLVPQIVLLGLFNGLHQSSIDCFFNDQGPASMRKYMKLFSSGVNGVGLMGSALSVYIVGRISSRGDERRNWFQPTINKSRLDNYYWVLAGISAANLVVFGVLACLYRYRESSSGGSEGPENESDGEEFEDDASCCCC